MYLRKHKWIKVILILINLVMSVSCSHSEKASLLEKKIKSLKDQQIETMQIATKNKTSVKAFFDALTSENIERITQLFTEKAKHINPYHSELFPRGANGREEIAKYWQPAFLNFDGMTFIIKEIYAMEDPNIVFVEYTGNIKLKDNAGVYSNHYYSTFKFNSRGEITEYVEIFNPIVAARGFGLIKNIK